MLLKAHGKSLRGLFGSERFLPVWINNPDSIANAKVTFLYACTLICKCRLWFSMPSIVISQLFSNLIQVVVLSQLFVFC